MHHVVTRPVSAGGSGYGRACPGALITLTHPQWLVSLLLVSIAHIADSLRQPFMQYILPQAIPLSPTTSQL